jgi:hypothetical protein
MALYGGARDISMFRKVNRELMGNIISEEVIYYKYNVTTTKVNMYGESFEGRNYADPVALFALVEIGPQESPVSDLGVDFTWTLTFRFLRDDLLSPTLDYNASMSFGSNLNPLPGTYGANIHPEVGDIIQYQNGYWEVDNTNATQFFTGKDPDYPYNNGNGTPNPINPGLDQFGYNVEVRCDCHYVPSDRLNIINSRM